MDDLFDRRIGFTAVRTLSNCLSGSAGAATVARGCKRRRAGGIRLIAMATCVVAGFAGGADANTVSAEQLDVFLNPAIVAQVGQSALLSTATRMMARFGLGAATGFERSGAITFDAPGGLSPVALRKLKDSIAHSPGVVTAGIVPSPATRARLETMRAFKSASANPSVVGLIIRYRGQSMVELSHKGRALPASELARIQAIAGERLVSSRAMSNGAFVAYFSHAIPVADAISIIHRFDQDPTIAYVSPDAMTHAQLVPNDPYFPQQWSLMGPPGGIDAEQAWDVTTGSPSGVVAVVDTGILYHPEFAGRILPGFDFISNPANAGDGNGWDPDPTDTGTWAPTGYCGPGSPAHPSEWHGTHVTGIIAAAGNNGTGIAGLDWQTGILPVRVIGKCGGDTADVVDGMMWAAGLPVPGASLNPRPARVINMSLGGPTPCWEQPAEQEATVDLLVVGAAVVVSAGNFMDEAANYSPAGCFGVLTIGATGPSGDRASYSNYSTVDLALSAPGGDEQAFGPNGGILSTYASGAQSDPGYAIYAPLQGTSMAAPHVSGTISLMLAANPSLTIAQIHDILVGTATPFAPGTVCAQTDLCGAGILNAGKAVAEAAGFRGVRWNYSDQWYNPAESGWGIQVTAQGDLQFVTWYTYGSDGYPLWFTMQLSRVGQDIFSGPIYVTTGVSFPAIHGQQASTSTTQVGTATLFFYDYFDGALIYTMNGQTTVKPITRLEYASPATVCTYTTASRAAATNYQDIWWNPQESGWGINLIHQGGVIFATWFTYYNGRPFWFYLLANQSGTGRFSGTFYGTTGTPYYEINGTKALVGTVAVGTGSLTFFDGEHGEFDFNVLGYSGTEQIQRDVFASPVTTCQPL